MKRKLLESKKLTDAERQAIKPEIVPFIPKVHEEQIERALRASGGNQSEASKMLRVSASAICQRIAGSEHLQQVAQEIREEITDIAETTLIKKIKEGNLIATIFYLKCQGKGRGYVEQVDLKALVAQGDIIINIHPVEAR